MNSGTAAKRSGVPPKTIRYYEGIGLIASAARAANGYRVYDETDVQTLRFIQRVCGRTANTGGAKQVASIQIGDTGREWGLGPFPISETAAGIGFKSRHRAARGKGRRGARVRHMSRRAGPRTDRPRS